MDDNTIRNLIEELQEKTGIKLTRTISRYHGTEEREIFRKRNLLLHRCIFKGPGESPVKECQNIVAYDSTFNSRYAFWEGRNIHIISSRFSNTDRAPLWYTRNCTLEDAKMKSPKTLRECDNITVKSVSLEGTESFWQIRGFDIDSFYIKSYYPFLECINGKIRNMRMIGKYSFQHCKNITIENSYLDTKDAFWHSENITIRNSHLKGEYIAWYAKNLTFIDCIIEGTQPFVESKGLRFENCTFLEDTDRAFERTTASGTLKKLPYSIYNPKDIDFISDDTCQIITDLKSKYKIRKE